MKLVKILRICLYGHRGLHHQTADHSETIWDYSILYSAISPVSLIHLGLTILSRECLAGCSNNKAAWAV